LVLKARKACGEGGWSPHALNQLNWGVTPEPMRLNFTTLPITAIVRHNSALTMPTHRSTTKGERRNDDREMVSAAPFKLRSVASYKKSVETKHRESLAKTQAAAKNSEWGRFYVQAWFWCLMSLLDWLFLYMNIHIYINVHMYI